jgi:hypothetical protein
MRRGSVEDLMLDDRSVRRHGPHVARYDWYFHKVVEPVVVSLVPIRIGVFSSSWWTLKYLHENRHRNINAQTWLTLYLFQAAHCSTLPCASQTPSPRTTQFPVLSPLSSSVQAATVPSSASNRPASLHVVSGRSDGSNTTGEVIRV